LSSRARDERDRPSGADERQSRRTANSHRGRRPLPPPRAIRFGFPGDSEAGCRSGERPIFRSLKWTLSLLTGWLHCVPPDPVVAAPNPLEARFGAFRVGGQSRLNRAPAQWLARELLCSRVDLTCTHRTVRLL